MTQRIYLLDANSVRDQPPFQKKKMCVILYSPNFVSNRLHVQGCSKIFGRLHVQGCTVCLQRDGFFNISFNKLFCLHWSPLDYAIINNSLTSFCSPSAQLIVLDTFQHVWKFFFLSAVCIYHIKSSVLSF
jgi:hypothetical protein